MAFDYYALLNEKIIPLLSDAGGPLILYRQDPAPTLTSYSGVAILSGFNSDQIDGITVKQEHSLLIASDIPEPQDDDFFEFAGEVYNYICHQKIAPNGTSLLYKIQVAM